MKMITEENRQAMISWIEEGIACSDDYGFRGNVLTVMKIALASLKAQPLAVTTQHQIDSLPSDYDVSMWSLNTKEDDDILLYTAPPVPVIKPVKAPLTECVGWVKEAINEHDAKWIESIRTAGYEVKS